MGNKPGWGKGWLRPGSDKDIMVSMFEVESANVYHFKNMYRYLDQWLDVEEWDSVEESGEKEYLYTEYVNPDGSKNHFIWWRVVKFPATPADNAGQHQYFRYFLKIDLSTLAVGLKEIMHRGYKLKTNVGSSIFRCQSFLQLDWNDEWEKSWITKKVDKFFRQRIYKRVIEDHKNDLYNQTYRFQQALKDYVKMISADERPKKFWPEKGYEGLK